MDFADLCQHIADAFPRLSPQLQRAAHHVLHRPDDVALLSMRRIAADAGVHPSTMVRLAHVFDFEGYTRFREPFQQRLRVRPAGYLDRARDLQARSAEGEAPALLKEVLATHGANLRECFEANSADDFIACAEVLSKARRIYMVGLRGCFPVAFFFNYVYRMFRSNAVLLEGGAGTFADGLRGLGKGDVMFAVSIHPYSQATVMAVEYARKLGGTAVVLTDSLVSPLAKDADRVLIMRNDSPSFFHSIAPAFAVVEALVVLMVAQSGQSALKAIAESERQLENFDAYWHQRSNKNNAGRPRSGTE